MDDLIGSEKFDLEKFAENLAQAGREAVKWERLKHFSCGCSSGRTYLWAFSPMKTPLNVHFGIHINRRNALKLEWILEEERLQDHGKSKAA